MFDLEFIDDFTTWLSDKYKQGIHGDPCGYNGASRKKIKYTNRCNRI